MKASIIFLLLLIMLNGKLAADAAARSNDAWLLRVPSRLQHASRAFHSFILNGTPADIRDYPHKLSMRLFGGFSCGATVISWKFALSAAHCFDGGFAAEYVS